MADWNYVFRRSPTELREQANAYRRAAKTAHRIDVVDALIKLAERFDVLADKREQEQFLRETFGDE